MKKLKLFYCISFAGYVTAGIFFIVLMILTLASDNSSEGLDTPSVCMAALFWLGVLTGTVFLTISAVKERRIYRDITKDKKSAYKRGFPFGAIMFFSGKAAVIVDCVFILSVVLTVIFYLLRVNVPWLIVLLISLDVEGAVFHSYLNGKINRCLMYLKNNSLNEED